MPEPSEKQKYTSFSICIEAIRNPHLNIHDCYAPSSRIDFNVCLEHGQTEADRRSSTCKTVNELFDPGLHAASAQPHTYRNCGVSRSFYRSHDQLSISFSRTGKARMFLKGIRLVLADGQACPSRRCRFIEYEDLPQYEPSPELPECMSI